jgi:uncharacterized protein (TIGR02466 family)
MTMAVDGGARQAVHGNDMARIEVSHHFAIPIYSLLLTGDAATSERDALLARLRVLRDTTPGKVVTNRAAWHSANDLHRDEDPAVKRFMQHASAFVRGALSSTYDSWSDAEPEIVEAWAVLGGKGASHLPHAHAPAFWSGVFYVSAEKCLATDGADPRGGKIEFANPVTGAASFGARTSVTCEPRDGLFLLFPGMMLHWVHPNPTDHERVVVSFNVMIEPRGKQ